MGLYQVFYNHQDIEFRVFGVDFILQFHQQTIKFIQTN